jgi:hypothetical protein
MGVIEYTVKHFIVFFAISLTLAGCEKEPVEFFSIFEYINSESAGITEIYVISNLRRALSESKAIELVEGFNRRTITVDMIKANSYFQKFYRETRGLTRDYKEGAPYPWWALNPKYFGMDTAGQQLYYHLDDRIINAVYSRARDGRSASLEFWPIIRNGKRGSLIKKIPDIDEYFAGSDGSIPDMPDIEFKWELSNIQ